ncbi:hypothetical protein F4802DRAFT_314271 [Xylaria palmicola]|nr:hypothetical protein F4802DRAFT_314271 [Xylaria palmicola]
MTVPGCSWLFLAVPGCSWLFLAVPGVPGAVIIKVQEARSPFACSRVPPLPILTRFTLLHHSLNVAETKRRLLRSRSCSVSRL